MPFYTLKCIYHNNTSNLLQLQQDEATKLDSRRHIINVYSIPNIVISLSSIIGPVQGSDIRNNTDFQYG